MKLLRFFLEHSRKLVILSLAAGIISGVCNAALLAIINSLLRRNGPVVPVLLWSFIGLCVLLPLSRFTSELLLNKLGQDALFRMRVEISRQILAAPLFHLENLGPHRLLAALTDDVPVITGTILVVPLLCINAATVIGCLIYMGFMSWTLLLIVLGFMAIGIAGYQLPIFKAQKIFMQARRDGDALLKHFRALTQGTKELKINHDRRKAFFTDLLEVTAASFRRNNMAGLSIYTAAASWGQALVFVVIGLILIVLPSLQHLDAKTLSGYAIALFYLVTPLQVIMNMLPGMTRASVAINNVKQLGFNLASHGTEEVFSGDVHAQEWTTLEVASVTHTYHREGESEDFVFGPIDLTFEAGEIVFITGGNGSGKTTFAKLLTGLYAPQTGEIRLDRTPIGEREREKYRQNFSVVFSDFFLFDQLLGFESGEIDSTARTYLDLLKLSHKVQIQDSKLSTIDLSQGQRKRLALLTAYLEDRPIYVFDEWAADQDPNFKNVFYLQLLPELKARHKTVFVISHDDRFYHVAERIIKLEEGQVVSDTRNAQNKTIPALAI
jgi:putative pyoverdin transport system ATP-binding/permease protein